MNHHRIIAIALVLSAGSLMAFVPGSNGIRECPGCKTKIIEKTMLSGNTFGARYWTDGKREAPMLPDYPALVKCPKCSLLFWIDDTKEIGEFSAFGDTTVPGVIDYLVPTVKDFYDFLEKGHLNDERECYIRVRAWWQFNDLRRHADSLAPAEMPATMVPNLEALAKLMDESIETDRLMKAEIYRETSRFTDCLGLLEHTFDKRYDLAATLIRNFAEQGSTEVVELK